MKKKKELSPEEKAIHKEKERLRANEVRKVLKQKYVDHLGGKCIRCDYDKNIKALEFHHRSETEKKFEIANSIKRKWKWERVEEELNKCDLLCANCHREVHDEEVNGALV